MPGEEAISRNITAAVYEEGMNESYLKCRDFFLQTTTSRDKCPLPAHGKVFLLQEGGVAGPCLFIWDLILTGLRISPINNLDCMDPCQDLALYMHKELCSA